MVKGVGEDAGCWMTSCLMDSLFSEEKAGHLMRGGNWQKGK